MNNFPFTLSVVIPLCKEGGQLKITLDEVSKEFEKIKEPYEIILVDDGSPDNTWDVIIEVAKKYPALKALRLSRNFGKESAICAGLEAAKGKAVIVMDGDLQHPPSLLPEMVKLWQESHADVVEAVKNDRGKETFIKKTGANLFYAILNKLSGVNLKGMSDFKLLDRQVVDAWLKMSERNLFFRGMIPWLGFKHVQLPFTVAERTDGESGWSFFRLVRLAVTALTTYSSLSLHFITLLGSLFLLFSFILGAQTLFNKFAGNAVSGFTTVIILQLTIGSLLMISLGIIGEYIARIFEEVKVRPRYIISQTINMKYDV